MLTHIFIHACTHIRPHACMHAHTRVHLRTSETTLMKKHERKESVLLMLL